MHAFGSFLLQSCACSHSACPEKWECLCLHFHQHIFWECIYMLWFLNLHLGWGGDAVLQSQWNFCFPLCYVKWGETSVVQDGDTQLWGSGWVGVLNIYPTGLGEISSMERLLLSEVHLAGCLVWDSVQLYCLGDSTSTGGKCHCAVWNNLLAPNQLGERIRSSLFVFSNPLCIFLLWLCPGTFWVLLKLRLKNS